MPGCIWSYLWGCLVYPPTHIRTVTTTGCSQPQLCLVEFQESPQMKTAQPLWVTCSSAALHSGDVIPNVQPEPPRLQFLATALYYIICHYQDFRFIIFVTALSTVLCFHQLILLHHAKPWCLLKELNSVILP